MNDAEKTAQAFARLYEITRTLRGENGCPWDKDQTSVGLRRSMMEECFEAIDAITSGEPLHVCEELGDVFFNVILQAYMYEQTGDFTVAQSLNDICDKLVRRHPHVFSESAGKSEMQGTPQSAGDVLGQWDKIKENLEGRKGESVLDDVPHGFPPLLRAYKLLKKAAKKGFTWKSALDARAKLAEELQEVEDAAAVVREQKRAPGDEPFTVSGGSPAVDKAQLHLEEEVGDALFALVNYARLLGVDPAVALDRANRKFYDRFTAVEKGMAREGLPMDGGHLDEMRALWEQAK